MDRQSTIGFILIFIVLVVWMWLNSPVQRPKQLEQTAKPGKVKDTVKIIRQKLPDRKKNKKPIRMENSFSDRAKGTEKIISVETDFYSAEISTKGGILRKWELKKFKTWMDNPYNSLIRQNGDFSVL